MLNARSQLSYSNNLFFKYALSRRDEGSVYAHNIVIERVIEIRVKENTVLNPNLDPGIIGKKHIILGMHVKDEQNRRFNIRMQTICKGIMEMMRFEFYGARASNNQLKSGEFYDQLKSAYQAVFINEYVQNSEDLISQYQVCNEQGEDKSGYLSILRTFVHTPVTNDTVKKKETQRLNDFEQLVYLSENNEKDDILKSEEGLVGVLTSKYEEMQKDDELQSTTMAIQTGGARYRNGLRDNFDEGKAAGKMEEERQLLYRQMQIRPHENYAVWLQALTEEQMQTMSTLLLGCDIFEPLRKRLRKSDEKQAACDSRIKYLEYNRKAILYREGMTFLFRFSGNQRYLCIQGCRQRSTICYALSYVKVY